MRKEYYTFIQEKGIRDFLSLIDEIPYSKKLKIVQNLCSRFTVLSINQAFNDYQINYVKRIDLRIIEKILIGLCKKYERVN